MLVSNGKYSYWRGAVKGKLSRNGSFIDVFGVWEANCFHEVSWVAVIFY